MSWNPERQRNKNRGNYHHNGRADHSVSAAVMRGIQAEEIQEAMETS